MQGNRGRDTSTEMRVRKALFASGYRYRVNYRPLPSLRRTADIAFTRAKLAVFIDGCFWHGCPLHFTQPKANAAYWTAKIQRNRERDRETNEVLEQAGWKVARYWEHEPVAEVTSSIRALVDAARPEGSRR
ncbi:very short patch repair endonuclease [Agromyces sp. C10]|uniref:very short patch repair endonuclease n=1 Tax=Agromyces sp. C10 TaxID=2935077 RepID=UPI00200B835C|nr:very short patch repair endonuclease [Agromyces sp. C10]MCK8609312.1 very short patch repair endonuclease [Agromyces sp. C10]